MRERDEIQFDVGEARVVSDPPEQYSRLTIEVLLDIRELLERIGSRIDDLQSR